MEVKSINCTQKVPDYDKIVKDLRSVENGVVDYVVLSVAGSKKEMSGHLYVRYEAFINTHKSDYGFAGDDLMQAIDVALELNFIEFVGDGNWGKYYALHPRYLMEIKWPINLI